MQAEDYKKVKFIISVLFYGILAVLGYFFVRYLLAWALPFVIGAFLAILIRPLVRLLKNKLRVPEGISSAIFVCLFYAAVFAILIVLIITLVDEIALLANAFPDIAETVNTSLDSFVKNISVTISEWPEELSKPILGFLDNLLPNIFAAITDFAKGFASNVTSVVGIVTGIVSQLPNIFLFIVALILSTLFITRDMSGIKAFIYMQLPEKVRLAVFEAREFFVLTVFRYLKAYSILITLTFCELSIGFLIMGIKYPFLVALIIAVIDILPVFGCGTVLLPWAVISLVNSNFRLAISLLVLYLIITVIRQAVEPKVVGSQVDLSPLITLFCIYVGFQAMGVLGMFLFPILLVIIRKLQESGYLKLWTPVKKTDK